MHPSRPSHGISLVRHGPAKGSPKSVHASRPAKNLGRNDPTRAPACDQAKPVTIVSRSVRDLERNWVPHPNVAHFATSGWESRKPTAKGFKLRPAPATSQSPQSLPV